MFSEAPAIGRLQRVQHPPEGAPARQREAHAAFIFEAGDTVIDRAALAAGAVGALVQRHVEAAGLGHAHSRRQPGNARADNMSLGPPHARPSRRCAAHPAAHRASRGRDSQCFAKLRGRPAFAQ